MNTLKNNNHRLNGVFNIDNGQLILRLFVGIAMFAKHGAEKIFTFGEMQQNFPDPIGIGPTAGLVFALVTDGICSLLVAVGLFTRFSSLLLIMNLFVVFTLMHGFSFKEGHAEMVFIYFGAFLSIFITGPGKYSLDAFFGRKKK